MFRLQGFISFNYKNRHRLILAACWLLGLYAGYTFLSHTSVSSVSLMLLVAENRMSIVGRLLFLVLPFVITAVSLRYSKPFFVFLFIFLKAFCFSWCAYGLTVAFLDAGWLVRWLLLFSDSCSVVLLLWFLFRNPVATGTSLRSDLLFCTTASVAIGCVDFCFISPFAEMLINH